MLENYSDARTWEKRLSASLPKVRFIAELPLTHEDWTRINDHVVSVLQSPSESSLDDAITLTPAVIACYLVLRGVYTYPEEPFWRYCNSQHQQKLGNFFLDFIKDHGLASISVPSSHRYITAILFHGFIPRAMAPSLYSQVIHPLVKREFVDPTSSYELQHWIDTHRAQYELLEELQEQYRALYELKEEAAFWREEAQEFAIDLGQIVHFFSQPSSTYRRPDQHLGSKFLGVGPTWFSGRAL